MSYSLIKSSEPRDKSLITISCIVIALHLVFVGWMALTISFSKPPMPQSPRRLIVQTVSLTPPSTMKSAMVMEEVAVASPPPPAKLAEPEEERKAINSPEEPRVLPQIREEIEILPPKQDPMPDAAISEPEPTPLPTPLPSVQPKPHPAKPVPKKEENKILPVKKPPPKKKTPPVKKPAKPTPKPVKKDPSPPKKEASPDQSIKKTEAAKEKAQKAEKEALAKAEKAAAEKKAAEKVAADKKEAEIRVAEAQRKKEAEEKALKARHKQLLTDAQERIAKIGQSRDKLSPGNSAATLSIVPSTITSLHIDDLPGSNSAPLSDQEVTYRDELASRLKLLLKLPEYGEVKIKLTLARSGKVAKIVVVNAKSAVNRKHIEKTLPSLTFPAFGANFSDDQEYTFTITLSNEL